MIATPSLPRLDGYLKKRGREGKAPPHGLYKINTDAAIFNQQGIGCLLHPAFLPSPVPRALWCRKSYVLSDHEHTAWDPDFLWMGTKESYSSHHSFLGLVNYYRTWRVLQGPWPIGIKDESLHLSHICSFRIKKASGRQWDLRLSWKLSKGVLSQIALFNSMIFEWIPEWTTHGVTLSLKTHVIVHASRPGILYLKGSYMSTIYSYFRNEGLSLSWVTQPDPDLTHTYFPVLKSAISQPDSKTVV